MQNVKTFVAGRSRGKSRKVEFLCDMDMGTSWGNEHCVGLVINLLLKSVEILDCNIVYNETTKEINMYMNSLLLALPYVLARYLPLGMFRPPEDGTLCTSIRISDIYQNEISGTLERMRQNS
ncbi:hypothetical protein Bca4012_063133 [Brassica carinata]